VRIKIQSYPSITKLIKEVDNFFLFLGKKLDPTKIEDFDKVLILPPPPPSTKLSLTQNSKRKDIVHKLQ
jgi:hypothetical protein